MAAVTLPIVTTYNDSGVKGAQFSLKGLMTSQLGAGLSAAALVQQLGKAVTAFNEDEAAQTQLKIAVQNSTGATDAQVAGMEDQIKKMEMSSAVADDHLRPSLQTLVRSTKDLSQAQGLLNLALDISAGTGKDLESVSLALAKANNGNFGALSKLGVQLDATAVKSKDFDTIQRQLAISFEGASAAAANSAQGGVSKLKIAVDNLYEAVGKNLSPVVTDFATVAANLITKSSEGAKEQSGWTWQLNKWTGKVADAVNPVHWFGVAIHNLAENQKELSTATGHTMAEFRLMDQMLTNKYNEALKKTKAELEALRKKQAEAAKVAKEHADTLRSRVVTAVDSVAQHLQDAKDQLKDFADATSDAITGSVSLADAFKTQSDADQDVTDALKTRSDAYTALSKINPVEDAEKYAEALQKVRDSEYDLATAQKTRASADYGKVFGEQIAKAKQFASNLQTLVAQGLSKAGLAQLINLGPIAGAQVTSEMIQGTGSLSLGQLNTGLADIASAGQNLGLAAGQSFFGANVSAGQTALDKAKTYQITVNAGLVSNPAQVGREIIEAIKSAERLSGQVFVSV